MGTALLIVVGIMVLFFLGRITAPKPKKAKFGKREAEATLNRAKTRVPKMEPVHGFLIVEGARGAGAEITVVAECDDETKENTSNASGLDDEARDLEIEASCKRLDAKQLRKRNDELSTLKTIFG